MFFFFQFSAHPSFEEVFLDIGTFCETFPLKKRSSTSLSVVFYDFRWTAKKTYTKIYEIVWVVSAHLRAVIPLCDASSASIGTVVIAYIYHDAAPATFRMRYISVQFS